MMPRGLAFLATCMLALTQPCVAQVNLQVHRGWGDKQRAGRWNPVTVRASAPAPQDVTLDIVSPSEGGFAATIREHVAIGPLAATYELLAPNHYSPARQGVVLIRDAESGRTLAQFPQPGNGPPHVPSELGPGGVLIGISGRPTQLLAPILSRVADAGYLPPRFLPRTAIGYDAIEILYLNQPKLDELDVGQKRAILDWVRAGGSLLFCPADGPLPAADALAAALPATVGDATAVDLPAAVLKESGLPPRFAHLAGHALAPAADARPVQLLPGSNLVGYSGRYGLGRIVVAPLDLGSFEFEPDVAQARGAAFWRPIVTELICGTPPEPKRQYDAPYYGYESESDDQQREGAASGTLCDFVAAASPPVSRFDVPLTLLAVLFLIGPVDSVVLFALGRRPWTWTTLPAWLALLVCGGAFAVARLRTHSVECRTVRLLDQADDTTVCVTELIGLSSSGRGPWGIEASSGDGPRSWWQPVIPGLARSQEIRPEPNVRFHASDAGMTPEPIVTEGGLPRFLRCDRIAAGAPVVQASLTLVGPDDAPSLSGTIRNVSGGALKDVRVRTKWGVVAVPLGPGGTLAAGQTVSMSLAARGGEPFAPEKVEGQYQSYGYFGSRHLSRAVREADLWAVAPDLSGRRTLQVDQLIGRGNDDFACVYAQTVDPIPTTTLNGAGDKTERTFEWIRAVVPLRR